MAKYLKVKLDEFQKEAKNFCLGKKSTGLFMPTGSGKTIVALRITAKRIFRKKLTNGLILCPKIMTETWEHQIKTKTFINLDINYGFHTKGISIVNFEKLARVKPRELEYYKYQFIIIDESHKIKNPKSKTCKRVLMLCKHPKYKLLLTGTPIEKNLVEMWSQVNAISPHLWGDDHFKFLQRFTYGVGWENKIRIIKPSERKYLLHKIKPYIYYVNKESSIKIPKSFDKLVYYSLPKKVFEQYKQLEQELYLKIKDREVSLSLKLPLRNKLSQITNGFLIDDETIIHLHSKKLNLCKDIIKDLGKEKIVIFAYYAYEIHLLKEMLKKLKVTFATIEGGSKDNFKNKENFQNKKTPQVLIVQINAGGIGIDLFVAAHAIIYSMSYFIAMHQAIARLVRRGQKRSVTFYYLLARYTVNEDDYRTLKTKGNYSQNFLNNFLQRVKHVY